MSKVLVHVGAPKTGTSFLQDLLFQHRADLAETGILYPADRFDAHFLAALDLLELPWGGLERQAVGAWDRLADEVRAWPGTSIVSHEILASATKHQVARALTSFGDVEVHIVFSARDLVRQVPAEWQENVKHRRTLDYATFLRRIQEPGRMHEPAPWFWSVQEIPDILDRWGSTLDPRHVHVVTVPPAGAPRGLLWERFAAVIGLEASAYETETERANPSLGAPETDFIRRVNARVNGILPNEAYRAFVRELLAHRTLSQRATSPRLSIPGDARSWAADLCKQWVEELAGRGYDVVGSLDELLPSPEVDEFVDPDRSPDDEVALEATVTLLGEAARLQADSDHLRAELEQTRSALAAALARSPVHRLKRRILLASEHNRAVARALAAYRRRRGASSRPA